MNHTTIISTENLAENIHHPDWIIFDCRFSLNDPEAGSKAYQTNHIGNARYAHLDNDLSSAITVMTGRHPLPDFSILANKLGAWGVSNHSQVIVYDEAAGAFAGRMWWLLRCLGHENVAVLDGGIKQWEMQGHNLSANLPTLNKTDFQGTPDKSMWLTTDQVQNSLNKGTIKLIDARTPERFKGDQEPIDLVAGHIPGALNRPFQHNLNNNGLFLTSEELREQFVAFIGDTCPDQIVHMCGSGVTACQNLLAMEIAGLNGSRLYTGSWSEWIRDKHRPIASTNIKQ